MSEGLESLVQRAAADLGARLKRPGVGRDERRRGRAALWDALRLEEAAAGGDPPGDDELMAALRVLDELLAALDGFDGRAWASSVLRRYDHELLQDLSAVRVSSVVLWSDDAEAMWAPFLRRLEWFEARVRAATGDGTLSARERSVREADPAELRDVADFELITRKKRR